MPILSHVVIQLVHVRLGMIPCRLIEAECSLSAEVERPVMGILWPGGGRGDERVSWLRGARGLEGVSIALLAYLAQPPDCNGAITGAGYISDHDRDSSHFISTFVVITGSLQLPTPLFRRRCRRHLSSPKRNPTEGQA